MAKTRKKPPLTATPIDLPPLDEPSAIIRADRLKSLERRHPWVFSGAVARVDGSPNDGDVILVRAADGRPIGRADFNSRSQITLHMLTFDADTDITADFWRKRLSRAIMRRSSLYTKSTNAVRLVNAESDALPGLIVDRYADFLVLQALTTGMDRRKTEIAHLLMNMLPSIRGVYERSDADVRAKEGLSSVTGVLAGDAPPPLVEITENGVLYLVDVRQGHKTGFYLDQRDARAALARAVLRDSVLRKTQPITMLNCFSYTGGFSVAALKANSTVQAVNLDASADALHLARQNYALNKLPSRDEDFVVGDVFRVLREYRDAGSKFDLIVLDPPKFANNASQIERACRGYKDINWLAFGLLHRGGLLFSFSCSGLIEPMLFQKVVTDALIDAKREGQIIGRLTAGEDHPVGLTFPEGMYLKGLICRVW